MKNVILAILSLFLALPLYAADLHVGDTLSCFQAKDEVTPEVTTEAQATGCVGRAEPGKKFTIIIMSASWCSGCTSLFENTIAPNIDALTKNATLRYAGFDRDLAKRLAYFKHLATTKKIFGASLDNMEDLGQYIAYIPSILLLDTNGKVLYFVDGAEAIDVKNIISLTNMRE